MLKIKIQNSNPTLNETLHIFHLNTQVANLILKVHACFDQKKYFKSKLKISKKCAYSIDKYVLIALNVK